MNKLQACQLFERQQQQLAVGERARVLHLRGYYGRGCTVYMNYLSGVPLKNLINISFCSLRDDWIS